MTVKLLTEQHLEYLSLKGGCTGSYEYTLVKMPHCWKSHATAHLLILISGAGSPYIPDGEFVTEYNVDNDE